MERFLSKVLDEQFQVKLEDPDGPSKPPATEEDIAARLEIVQSKLEAAEVNTSHRALKSPQQPEAAHTEDAVAQEWETSSGQEHWPQEHWPEGTGDEYAEGYWEEPAVASDAVEVAADTPAEAPSNSSPQEAAGSPPEAAPEPAPPPKGATKKKRESAAADAARSAQLQRRLEQIEHMWKKLEARERDLETEAEALAKRKREADQTEASLKRFETELASKSRDWEQRQQMEKIRLDKEREEVRWSAGERQAEMDQVTGAALAGERDWKDGLRSGCNKRLLTVGKAIGQKFLGAKWYQGRRGGKTYFRVHHRQVGWRGGGFPHCNHRPAGGPRPIESTVLLQTDRGAHNTLRRYPALLKLSSLLLDFTLSLSTTTSIPPPPPTTTPTTPPPTTAAATATMLPCSCSGP